MDDKTLRSKLIRLASEKPELRPQILPLLRLAMEHPSEEARKQYLQEHSGADPKNHTVSKGKDKGKDKGKVYSPKNLSDVFTDDEFELIEGEMPLGEKWTKDDVLESIEGAFWDEEEKAEKLKKRFLSLVKRTEKSARTLRGSLGTANAKQLRLKLIRLAYEKPELRPEILPLVAPRRTARGRRSSRITPRAAR